MRNLGLNNLGEASLEARRRKKSIANVACTHRFILYAKIAGNLDRLDGWRHGILMTIIFISIKEWNVAGSSSEI